MKEGRKEAKLHRIAAGFEMHEIVTTSLVSMGTRGHTLSQNLSQVHA